MKRTCPIAVAVVLLNGALPAQAQTREPGVRDAAGMFSPPAVQKADAALKSLKRDGGWDVYIQTIDTLGSQTVEQRAIADAKALNAHGLVVLIAKANHKLAVEPSDSAKRAFSKDKVNRLAKLLTDRFKAKEYDQGLADAVAAIEADARVVGVRDTAKMFSADAVKQANESLAAFRRKSKWQVIIETVDSLSGQSPSERAVANGKAMNVHGLSIVIDKGHHQIATQPSESAQRAFPTEHQAAIRKAFEEHFKAKDYDKGLRAAVAVIETGPAPRIAAAPKAAPPVDEPAKAAPPVDEPAKTTAANPPAAPERRIPPAEAPAAEAPKKGSVLPVVILAVGGILILLWVMSLVRRRAPAPQPQAWQQPQPPQPGYAPQPAPQGYRPPPPSPGYAPQPGYPPAPGYGPPPPQHGGAMGNFAAGALGGLGGAIAGNILYDQFGRPHHPQTPGSAPHEHSAAGVFPPAAPNVGQEPPRETFDPNAGATGDWGGDEQASEPAGQWGQDAGATGDWGGDAPAPDAGATGDWGNAEPAADDSGATGDWGGDAEAPGNTGDWGGDASAADDPGATGDWGGDASESQDQGGGW